MNNQQQDYGQCAKCGASKVLNPRTNKIFCQAKCWLNGGNNANQNLGARTASQGAKTGSPDWDAIAEGKVRTLFALEVFKKGEKLTPENKQLIKEFTDFCMGKAEQPPLPQEPPTVSPEQAVENMPIF